MGLLQRAIETFDKHKQLVGVYRERHETLAPVSHTTVTAGIEITLDISGEFKSARKVEKNEGKIVIPVSEESLGRSGKPPRLEKSEQKGRFFTHPLCEQIGYLSGQDNNKYSSYIARLKDWAESEYSHPFLISVLKYVMGKTILSDLNNLSLIKFDPEGKWKNEIVRWRVIGSEDDNTACWMNPDLQNSFIKYYRDYRKKEKIDNEIIDYVTGDYTIQAIQHAKGIVPENGNAKLISSNDNEGFTYRGRFKTAQQALDVGYESSQKAHNVLKWLVAEQGIKLKDEQDKKFVDKQDENYYKDVQAFLCWNPNGYKVCNLIGKFRKNNGSGENVVNPSNYREELKRTLRGYRAQLPDSEDVVIAIFDAATKGRLALAYYNELKASDFLDRLEYWDATCCWINGPFGVQSPSLLDIVNYAFGTLRGNYFDTDKKLKKQQVQRLVHCRVDMAMMPHDIEKSLVRMASRLMLYGNDKKSDFLREKVLFTVCAVIRKYYIDMKKEEIAMELEKDKEDRSYQYGRLLAVLEKIERDTYDDDEKREPNAIRLQFTYCQRPFWTTETIHKQLERAYFPRLRPGTRAFYKKLIGEIFNEINKFPENEWNRPLDDTYLMGYYLQRNELYTSHKKEKEETDNEQI